MTTNWRAARGWMFFDFATQPIHTLLVTFIFAPYFTSAVASDPVTGQAHWGYMIAFAGVVVAIGSPILGAIADISGPRKPWVALFSVIFMGATASLWFATPGMGSTLGILFAFAMAIIAVEFNTTFTNAMLPDIAATDDIGRVSGQGWGFGYTAGLITLVFTLLFLAENDTGRTLIGLSPIGGLDAEMREGTRSVGPITAVWCAVFMIPFFLLVPDQPRRTRSRGAIRAGLRSVKETLQSLPQRKQFTRYLLSSMFYRDALGGLFVFGGIYAQGMLGLSVVDVGVFGIVAVVTGIFGAWYGGKLDSRHGPRRVIFWSIVILLTVTALVVTTTTKSILFIPVAEGSPLPKMVFYFTGGVIGLAAGPLQAASRTMLVFQSEPDRMTESFGLYALAGKATAFMAPLSIGVLTDITGSQQIGMVPIVVLFLIGLFLLLFVNDARSNMAHDETVFA